MINDRINKLSCNWLDQLLHCGRFLFICENCDYDTTSTEVARGDGVEKEIGKRELMLEGERGP